MKPIQSSLLDGRKISPPTLLMCQILPCFVTCRQQAVPPLNFSPLSFVQSLETQWLSQLADRTSQFIWKTHSTTLTLALTRVCLTSWRINLCKQTCRSLLSCLPSKIKAFMSLVITQTLRGQSVWLRSIRYFATKQNLTWSSQATSSLWLKRILISSTLALSPWRSKPYLMDLLPSLSFSSL